MVAPVSSSDSTSSAAADALSSATASNSLGKDAFLKLLVAQLSHQDPLKPMDDTQFVSQLAQYSSLEQTMGINTRLDSLATQERSLANTSMSALVGKSVTVKGSNVALASGQVSVPVNFTLANKASEVDLKIADSNGNTVRTLQLGGKSAGLNQITWDGKNDAGIAQPAGSYVVSVTAKDAAGSLVDVSQETTGILQSVNFQNGDASLYLDNGVTAPASDLLRINSQGK